MFSEKLLIPLTKTIGSAFVLTIASQFSEIKWNSPAAYDISKISINASGHILDSRSSGASFKSPVSTRFDTVTLNAARTTQNAVTKKPRFVKCISPKHANITPNTTGTRAIRCCKEYVFLRRMLEKIITTPGTKDRITEKNNTTKRRKKIIRVMQWEPRIRQADNSWE